MTVTDHRKLTSGNQHRLSSLDSRPGIDKYGQFRRGVERPAGRGRDAGLDAGTNGSIESLRALRHAHSTKRSHREPGADDTSPRHGRWHRPDRGWHRDQLNLVVPDLPCPLARVPVPRPGSRAHGPVSYTHLTL